VLRGGGGRWEALPGGGVLPCGGRLSSPPVVRPGAALARFSLSLSFAFTSLTSALTQPCVLIVYFWLSIAASTSVRAQHANLATESSTKEQRSNNAQDKLLTKYGASDHCVDCAQDVD